MAKACQLSSGSKGNCIYIASDTTEILVDFGMSYAYVQDALQKIGTDVKNISGFCAKASRVKAKIMSVMPAPTK